MSEIRYDGFGEKALPFLKALGFHQNKDWFNENRAIFEEDLLEPQGRLIDDLAARLAEEKLPLTCSRKTSVFRINRDVRFSKNKNPYKTNLGAVVTRSGTKGDPGLLYVHVAPEECFTGAGFYQLAGDELRAFREAAVGRPDELRAALEPLLALGFSFRQRDRLKRLPRGFEAVDDPLLAEILVLKHPTLSRAFSPDRLKGRLLLDDLVELARAALPFLEFGWRAIDPVRGQREESERR